MEVRKSREARHSIARRVAAVAVMAAGMAVAWQEIEYQLQPDRKKGLIRGGEDVIRADLYTMRSCIDQHLADKGCYPESLQTLVIEGYLRSIPVDPFSGTAEGAWKEIHAESTESDALWEKHSDDNQVLDVRYANVLMVGSDGTPIRSW